MGVHHIAAESPIIPEVTAWQAACSTRLLMKQALLVCMVAGCGVSAGANDGDDDPSAPHPVAAGTYQLVSRVDVTVEALLPDQAEEIVSTLRSFSTNPARTLIDTADEAGVPAVGDLYGALPSLITDRLDGWI